MPSSFALSAADIKPALEDVAALYVVFLVVNEPVVPSALV
jgi:hypothetical protein